VKLTGVRAHPAGNQQILKHATTIAQKVRTALLRLKETPRDLAGTCGLTALLVAVTLDDPSTLCTGFYLKYETFLGRRGHFPHRHAWNRVGAMIVDATATQFNQRSRSVHVAPYNEDRRYLETARAEAAIDDILINWRGRALPAYAQLARQLRQDPLVYQTSSRRSQNE